MVLCRMSRTSASVFYGAKDVEAAFVTRLTLIRSTPISVLSVLLITLSSLCPHLVSFSRIIIHGIFFLTLILGGIHYCHQFYET